VKKIYGGFIMSDNVNTSEQINAQGAEPGNIMQHIQDMIGDLLKNAVDKMHKTETHSHLEHAPGQAAAVDPTAQMGLKEIKNFVSVMQKFIDNVNVMVARMETDNPEHGDTDDMFLDGYMATADNVLEMAAFSMKDSLTGLSNRYGFDNRLILEWNRATRDKSYLSLVIFSIDGFKDSDSVNYDDVLLAVSRTLENSIKRTTDFIARWSDEEFAVLLPITNSSGASIVADRITAEIKDMDIPGNDKNKNEPTVSIGVCSHTPEQKEKAVDFIHRAHNAYILAQKRAGNSIEFA